MPTKKKQRNRDEAAPEASTSDDEPMSDDLSRYVTTREAAEMLGVATEHINHLLLRGKLRGIKPGGRDWLVFTPSIEKYNETKSAKGRPRSRKPKLGATE